MYFYLNLMSLLLLATNFVTGHKYSVEFCANYLCSEFVEETSAYLTNRCVGEFADSFIAEATEEYVESISSISLPALVILAGVMFIISFSIGLFVSKYHSVGGEEPI